MKAAEPTQGDLSDSCLFPLRRDDGDGRDDVSGSGSGVKNIVTIDTTVTGTQTHLRPHRAISRLLCVQAEKITTLFLCLGQRSVSKNRLLSVPDLHSGYHMQTRQRLPQKPQAYPLPTGSPRHFAARRDESVIVGYYTLKKCVPRWISAYIQTQKWRYNAHGEKRRC